MKILISLILGVMALAHCSILSPKPQTNPTVSPSSTTENSITISAADIRRVIDEVMKDVSLPGELPVTSDASKHANALEVFNLKLRIFVETVVQKLVPGAIVEIETAPAEKDNSKAKEEKGFFAGGVTKWGIKQWIVISIIGLFLIGLLILVVLYVMGLFQK